MQTPPHDNQDAVTISWTASDSSGRSSTDGSDSYPKIDLLKDEFRLLRLLPSDGSGAQIRCELISANHSEWKDRYVAVSYVWGPPSPERTILVNDVPFQIRENLYMFLASRQEAGETSRMWIDAISIDQESIPERNHQVQRMKYIFADATFVYSWLGPTVPDLEWLFENLAPKGMDTPGQSSLLHYYRSHNFYKIFKGVSALSENVYWSRIWIVQEFILAKRVYLLCGNTVVEWNRLCAYRRLFPSGAWRLESMAEARNERIKADARCGFEATFFEHSHRSCRLPQDKVYALLGLMHGQDEELQTQHIVNYRQDSWKLLQILLTSCHFDFIIDFASSFAEQVVGFTRSTLHIEESEYIKSITGHDEISISVEEDTVGLARRLRSLDFQEVVGGPIPFLVSSTGEIKELDISDPSQGAARSEFTYVYTFSDEKRPSPAEKLYAFGLCSRDPTKNVVLVARREEVVLGPNYWTWFRVIGVRSGGWCMLRRLSTEEEWSSFCDCLLKFAQKSRIRKASDSTEESLDHELITSYTAFLKLIRYFLFFEGL